MSKVHVRFLVSYLNEHKNVAFLGSDLLKKLISYYPELSEANGRKIISNCKAKGLIDSSEPVSFDNNQYAYFAVGSEKNYQLYKELIKKYKQQLFRVIYALRRNKNILSINDFYRISGVSSEPNSHSVTANRLLQDLELLNIAEKKETNGIEYIHFINFEPSVDMVERLTDDLVDKNFLISCCVQWLIKCNIVSEKNVCYIGSDNQFSGIERNHMFWDSIGFTNTIGIGGKEKEFQTMVVIDFLANYKYEEYDFQGFQSRVDHLIFSVRKAKRKVLPIVIVNSISPAAKALLREKHYMFFSLDSLFGKNAIQVAKEYRQTINAIEHHIEIKNYSQIVDEVAGLYSYVSNNANEVNLGNIKGALFEYLMFPVLERVFNKKGDRIIHSFKGSVSNKKYEFDYRIETETENIFIELKGYKNSNIIPLGKKKANHTPEKNSILWSLKQYEIAKKQFSQTNERKTKFCFITTCKIEEQAKEALSKRKKDKSEYLEIFYDYESLLSLLRSINSRNEIHVIKQFFGEEK